MAWGGKAKSHPQKKRKRKKGVVKPDYRCAAGKNISKNIILSMKLVLIKYRERFRRVLMAHTGYNELSAPDQSVVLGAGAPKAIALCSGM